MAGFPLIEMQVAGVERLKALSSALKVAGRGDLERKMRRNIRRASKPAEAAVKSAILGVNVSGSSRGGTARPDRSTALRRRVATAVGTSITKNGVRIVVRGRKVDPTYGRNLAWYLAGSGRPWRHPVFGRRENPQDWQEQRGQRVFFPTLQRHAPQFRGAVQQAMDETAAELDRVTRSS